MKKRFRFTEHPEKDKVMWCKTEEEAEEFCRILSENGRTWAMGKSYYGRTNWENFRNYTCYYFNKGTIGNIHDVEDWDMVMEFSDYDWKHSMPFLRY